MESISIPERTSARMRAEMFTKESQEAINSGRPWVIDLTQDDIESYPCMDCGLKTFQLEPMEEHQRHQTRHHSFRQQIRRWAVTHPGPTSTLVSMVTYLALWTVLVSGLGLPAIPATIIAIYFQILTWYFLRRWLANRRWRATTWTQK